MCTGTAMRGSVIHNEKGLRVTGKDQSHIKNVLSGIEDNKGEMWVTPISK